MVSKTTLLIIAIVLFAVWHFNIIQPPFCIGPVHSNCIIENGPAPTPEPTIQIPTEIPTPIITATPVPTLPPEEITRRQIEAESVWMGQNNGRYIGQWFNITRYDVGQSRGWWNQINLNARVTVYRLFTLDNYTWWDADNGTYYLREPDPGMRFLVAFIRMEIPGINATDDARPYMFGPLQFAAQVDGNIIPNDTIYQPCTRIKELEFRGDYTGTNQVTTYGYTSYYNPNNENAGLGGVVCTESGWLHPGSSNAMDGFIIYEIPSAISPYDVKIIASFSSLGSAYWEMKK